jgi:hypothetical protein
VFWTVLATTALGILLGYLAKTPCTGPTFDQFGISPNLGLHKYDKLCYSDVQQLWVGRGVPEHTFPYLHGKLVDDPNQPQGNLVGGAVEYPIVTGVFMWFAGLFARNDADYLRVTALLLAPFGLLTGGHAGQAVRPAGVHLGGRARAGALQRAQLGLPRHGRRGRRGLGLVPRPARVWPRPCSASARRPRSTRASSRCRCCWSACTCGTSAARPAWWPAPPASGC